MARKKISIEEELKKIEAEERVILGEEKRIEQKEDLIRVFEELGLMRWKSYYILTAGAILLLSLTFVTALWVMHDQLVTLESTLDELAVDIDSIEGMLVEMESATVIMPPSGPPSGPPSAPPA